MPTRRVVALSVSLTGLALASACVRVPVNESIGRDAPVPTTLSTGPIAFEYESLDEHSVSAPALRGKPAVLAFLVSDTLAGQAEAAIFAGLAERQRDKARFVLVAVEPEDRHELVSGFVRFFTEKTHAPLLGAMADKDTLLGQGPFGDVRTLTIVILDASGRIALRKSGVVQGSEIARTLATM